MTERLWSASMCVSRMQAVSTAAIASRILATTSGLRPSLKFGTHSTSLGIGLRVSRSATQLPRSELLQLMVFSLSFAEALTLALGLWSLVLESTLSNKDQRPKAQGPRPKTQDQSFFKIITETIIGKYLPLFPGFLYLLIVP